MKKILAVLLLLFGFATISTSAFAQNSSYKYNSRPSYSTRVGVLFTDVATLAPDFSRPILLVQPSWEKQLTRDGEVRAIFSVPVAVSENFVQAGMELGGEMKVLLMDGEVFFRPYNKELARLVGFAYGTGVRMGRFIVKYKAGLVISLDSRDVTTRYTDGDNSWGGYSGLSFSWRF